MQKNKAKIMMMRSLNKLSNKEVRRKFVRKKGLEEENSKKSTQAIIHI